MTTRTKKPKDEVEDPNILNTDESDAATLNSEPDILSGSSKAGSVGNKKGEIVKIILHIKNPNVPSGQSVREFDELTHGEDFEKIAAEFESTNQALILSKEVE